MVWREAEVIAGAMRLLWYPLKLVWNMLKALRLAWRDIRNPASAAFVDAIQLKQWVSKEEAKRIRECDDPKVWDASHMRFVVRGTGLLAERALRMPKDIHTTGPAIHTWRGLAGAKKSD